jgi:hypothetical protein
MYHILKYMSICTYVHTLHHGLFLNEKTDVLIVLCLSGITEKGSLASKSPV